MSEEKTSKELSIPKPEYNIGDMVFYWDYSLLRYNGKCRSCGGKGKLILDKSEKKKFIKCTECYGDGVASYKRKKHFLREERITGIRINIFEGMTYIKYDLDGKFDYPSQKLFSTKEKAKLVPTRER